jgi:mRNA interferase MazF
MMLTIAITFGTSHEFSRGDVLIALFPHADGSSSKPLPVLVIQSHVYYSKIKILVVAAITSNLIHAKDPASHLIEANTPDGKQSGLRQDSVITCLNLATIEDSLMAKKIGAMSGPQMQKVNDCLKAALHIS